MFSLELRNISYLPGVGRGAGQDSAEARGPVQVCPRLLHLQKNWEVRNICWWKNCVKMSGSCHGGELSQLMRWYIVWRQTEYHKPSVMPSFLIHGKKYVRTSEPRKKYVRFVPSRSWRNPWCASFRVEDVSFVAWAEIYAGYQVSSGLTVNVKPLRIRIGIFVFVRQKQYSSNSRIRARIII